jgi:Tripartite tricarboxylate transporter family receptor
MVRELRREGRIGLQPDQFLWQHQHFNRGHWRPTSIDPHVTAVHQARPLGPTAQFQFQRNAGSHNRLALWLLSDALINRAICGVAVGLCDGRSGKDRWRKPRRDSTPTDREESYFAAERSLMPQLPTIAEQGFPDYEGVLWIGVMAPAGVPAGTIDLFAAAISEAVRSEGLAARLKRDGLEPVGNKAADYAHRQRGRAVAGVGQSGPDDGRLMTRRSCPAVGRRSGRPDRRHSRQPYAKFIRASRLRKFGGRVRVLLAAGFFSSKRVAGRQCPAANQQMRPLRRPAPRCSAVFKSNLANAASAVVDAGVSVGSFARTGRRTR